MGDSVASGAVPGVRSLAYRGAAPLLAALRPSLDAAGIVIASEPAAADAVVTFFTTQRELEDAYFATDGLVATMAPGSLLIDLSPATPDFARDLSAVATVSELLLVTAPIVLRDLAAAAPFAPDNVVVFAAGEDAAVERALGVLSLWSGSVSRRRNAVDAQAARAAMSLQTTALTLAAVEATVLMSRYDGVGVGAVVTSAARERGAGGEGAGARDADADAVVDVGHDGAMVGSVSAGATAVTDASGVVSVDGIPALDELDASMLAAIASEAFAGPFTIEMMMAQLTATLEAADDADLILPQAEAAQHLLELLAIIGGIDKAPAALALVYGDEESATRYGLDWKRAESFEAGDEHVHDDDEFDEDDGEFPLMVGFGDDDGLDYSSFDGPDPFEYSSN